MVASNEVEILEPGRVGRNDRKAHQKRKEPGYPHAISQKVLLAAASGGHGGPGTMLARDGGCTGVRVCQAGHKGPHPGMECFLAEASNHPRKAPSMPAQLPHGTRIQAIEIL